jgi:hypothetical protein
MLRVLRASVLDSCKETTSAFDRGSAVIGRALAVLVHFECRRRLLLHTRYRCWRRRLEERLWIAHLYYKALERDVACAELFELVWGLSVLIWPNLR